MSVLCLGFEILRLEEVVSFTTATNLQRRVMEKLGMIHDQSADFDHPRIPMGTRSVGKFHTGHLVSGKP